MKAKAAFTPPPIAALHDREAPDGAWWRLWTGGQWEPLATPRRPDAGEGQAR